MNSTQPSLKNNDLIPWGQITRVFPVLCGGLLFALALVIFISRAANPRLLPPTDALLQISRDSVLLLLGTATLITALFCFFARNTSTKLLLTAWLASTFAAYRVGLLLMGSKSTAAYWGTMADAFGVSPSVFDLLIQGTFALLLLGSCALLIVAWLTKGKIMDASQTANLNPDTAQEFKMPCPSCGGNIKSAIQNLGQKIPCPHCQTGILLRQPGENLKMSCFFCKEHIAFPAHAIGTKLKCPHCNRDIALKEPA